MVLYKLFRKAGCEGARLTSGLNVLVRSPNPNARVLRHHAPRLLTTPGAVPTVGGWDTQMAEIAFPFPMLAGHLPWSTEHGVMANGGRLSVGGTRASVKQQRQRLEGAGSVGKGTSPGSSAGVEWPCDRDETRQMKIRVDTSSGGWQFSEDSGHNQMWFDYQIQRTLGVNGDHPHSSPSLSHAVAFRDTVVDRPPPKQTAKETRPCTWQRAAEGETAGWGLRAGLPETSVK